MEVDAVLPNHSSSEPSHGSNADILEIDYGPWLLDSRWCGRARARGGDRSVNPVARGTTVAEST